MIAAHVAGLAFRSGRHVGEGRVAGLALLSRKEIPGGKFTIAFVGYDSLENFAALDLSYGWGHTG